MSLNGSDTSTGGSIIMPIDISTEATTRSMIRNGSRHVERPGVERPACRRALARGPVADAIRPIEGSGLPAIAA